MRPARAPASIDMLHTVIRPSIESERKTEPRYSMTLPMPPPVPMRPITPRITSFAVDPAGSSPSTVTAIHCGRVCGSVCVASTCSTSLVPMPNASAPNAPWVLVWLSPHTTVMPGCVSPCSGPMTCTMPCPSCPIGEVADAELRAVAPQHLDLGARDRVRDRLVDVLGRDVVVLGRDRQVGPAHRAAVQPEAVERLRARSPRARGGGRCTADRARRRRSARRGGPTPSRPAWWACLTSWY